MDRNTGKVIRDIEAVLRKIIAEQKEHPQIQLNNSQKIEIAIFQMLLKKSRLDKKAGWYDVPIAKFDEFFQILAKADEVIDGKTKCRL